MRRTTFHITDKAGTFPSRSMSYRKIQCALRGANHYGEPAKVTGYMDTEHGEEVMLEVMCYPYRVGPASVQFRIDNWEIEEYVKNRLFKFMRPESYESADEPKEPIGYGEKE